ncbi:MAG: hypothetical protein GX060_02175 [Firmicutes bacterium]|nr:hypothetical protein [Bacillota bacterium]
MKKAMLLALTVSLLLTGCFGGAQPKDTFVYALEADIVNLLPVRLTNVVSTTVSRQIHEPLVKYEDTYDEILPALATEWDMDPSGLSWTFKLRPNVKWHDGQPFTSEDVKYTYEKLLDPATKSVQRANYQVIEKIETPDPLTVVFHLSEPHGPFLDKMSQIPIMAKHHVSVVGMDDYNNKAIGTGPFMMVEWVPNDHVKLQANPNYWGGKPAIETLVFKPIPEASVRAMALEKGEVHYADRLTAEDYAKVAKSNKVTGIEVQSLAFAYFGHNNRNPLFADKRVRQALAYAIDRESIVRDVRKEAAIAASGPIAPTNGEWFNPDVKQYEYDPEKAKSLLAQAGWEMGSDGFLQKDGKTFSFSVILATGDETMRSQGVLIQKWLKDVGIDLKLEFLDWSVMNDRLDHREYEAMMLSMTPTADPDQYNYWHSTAIDNGFNDWCYSNAQVDKLLEQGRRETDPVVRKEIYDQVQAILAEDVAAVFLYHPKILGGLSKNFTGMTEGPVGQAQLLYKVQPVD